MKMSLCDRKPVPTYLHFLPAKPKKNSPMEMKELEVTERKESVLPYKEL